MTIFIAHRGFRVGVVENTFDAFNKAASLGVDYIELDVHVSKDGEVVVIHDATVDRVFDGCGAVRKLSWEHLSTLKSRNENQGIPLLRDVLTWARGKVKIMLELKGVGCVEPVARMIDEENLVSSIVFSSRNLDYLASIKEYFSGIDIKICLNITKCKKFTFKRFLKSSSVESLPFKFDIISLRANLVLGSEFIEKCHQFGIQALCWDFLSPESPMTLALNLHKKGIDGFLIDDPAMFVKLKEIILQ
ncbi:MAG: glycerophosphodiester phosphodiesterase [Promethearchaeota archaeon]